MKTALKIVSIVGLLFWTACCYLGMFYATEGNYAVAICVTLLIAVALFLSYLLMLKMQDKGLVQGNRDRARTTGIIMLGVYIVATLCSAFFVNHFVKSFDGKETIQNEAKLSVDELKTTFNEENDNLVPNSYRNWVNDQTSALGIHLSDINYEGTITETQSEFSKKMLGTTGDQNTPCYANLEQQVNDELFRIENAVVNAWNPFNALQCLKQLRNKSNWEAQVVEFSKPESHDNLMDFEKHVLKTPFNPVQDHDAPSIAPLTEANFSVTGISILIMVALQILILLGYLLSLRTGGGRDKIATSETGSIRSWSNTK